MKYLIVYDICEPKRLTKVAKRLEQIALRVQNSTFEIDNTVVDIKINKLFNELKEMCKVEEDKIFIYKVKSKEDITQKTDNWEMVF